MLFTNNTFKEVLMETSIKIIAQEIDSKTGDILHQHVVFEKSALLPKKINDLGFTHKEQIEILRQSQEALLHSQQRIINSHAGMCPKCGQKTKKRGKFDSDFHSVFSDHTITLQRTQCRCGWTSKISIDGTYGSALHPDLVELQSLIGAENSFQKTEEFLAKKCCAKRSINNHSRIQKTINQVGHLLLKIKQGTHWAAANDVTASNELTLVIDGTHLPSNTLDGRSFEVMTATVFNPNQVVKKDKNHNKILTKTVVVSAKNDKQKNIKTLTMNACLKQGMNDKTLLTVLTDGAKNCWSVLSELSSKCDEITTILDWFHMGKKFKNAEYIIPEELKKDYEKAKWCVWHGHSDKALTKLKAIQTQLKEDKSKLSKLMTYIKNNKLHIINYHQREQAGQIYTSQLAESMVNNLVNERQKHDKRMQWSRDGADAVLQIRSCKQSADWNDDWQQVQTQLYREAI